MTVSSVHLRERTAAQGFSRIGRLAATLLCLAGVVVLTVALRSGLYEYFHGGGRTLRGLSEVLMTTGGHSLGALVAVGLLGLVTTSSVMLGAVLGLYLPFPKKLLAGVLAFAAGSLIAALAIELGFEGAYDLVRHGASVRSAWVSIAGGFAVGAVIYYVTSLFLEQNGGALRYPSRFLEYALDRKRQAVGEKLALLSKCDLLRHLPPEQIEPLLDRVQEREARAGEIVFRTGDPGDALYIVAQGVVEVLNGSDQRTLAELGGGQAFGEMALLSEGTRTATIRAKTDTRLLTIGKEDFERLAGRGPLPRRTGAQAEPRARHRQPAQRRRQSGAMGADGTRERRPAESQRGAQTPAGSQAGQRRRTCHHLRQHPRHKFQAASSSELNSTASPICRSRS